MCVCGSSNSNALLKWSNSISSTTTQNSNCNVVWWKLKQILPIFVYFLHSCTHHIQTSSPHKMFNQKKKTNVELDFLSLSLFELRKSWYCQMPMLYFLWIWSQRHILPFLSCPLTVGYVFEFGHNQNGGEKFCFGPAHLMCRNNNKNFSYVVTLQKFKRSGEKNGLVKNNERQPKESAVQFSAWYKYKYLSFDP